MHLFCLVARAASFIAVARAEDVSPAFVSKRIAVLEAALQTRLFHRTTRHVRLTEDGETILAWSSKILEDVQDMEDTIAAAKAVPKGRLRISCSTGFGRNRLAPALSELMRRHPTLDIHLDLLDRPVDLIGEGFDIDVRVGGVHEPHLIAQPLVRNYRVFCASPEYLSKHGKPRTLAELSQHHCIVIRERDQLNAWRLTGPEGPVTARVTPHLTANNGEVVHRWAVDGHGIILRSFWDVAADIHDGNLVHILPDYIQDADVSAIYPQRLDRSGRLRVCILFLREWFSHHPVA
jgi:LysR family transcriptional activator of dmlA